MIVSDVVLIVVVNFTAIVVVVAVVATDIVIFHVVHFVAVVAAVVVAVALVVDVFANVTVNVVVVVAVVAVLFVFVVVYLLPLLRNLSLFSLGKKSIELIVTNFAEILRIGEIFWARFFSNSCLLKTSTVAELSKALLAPFVALLS